MASNTNGEYEEFARRAMPALIRAFIATRGQDAPDAAAEALAYAWEHWSRVRELQNPLGFLFRVGQSRTRRRPRPMLPAPEAVGLPEVEPRLIAELQRLPETQQTAVWLVYACEWQYSEVAAALGTTRSMVGNHVSRGLRRLRRALEVAHA